MTHSKTADKIEFAEIEGLYWLHLYDHNCIVDRGVLEIAVGKDGTISGDWKLGWNDGDSVQGEYDVNSGRVVLHFGYVDDGYSLWGPITKNLKTGPDERELAIAGHWGHSGIGGPTQWGAFYAQQLTNTAQQMKAFQPK